MESNKTVFSLIRTTPGSTTRGKPFDFLVEERVNDHGWRLERVPAAVFSRNLKPVHRFSPIKAQVCVLKNFILIVAATILSAGASAATETARAAAQGGYGDTTQNTLKLVAVTEVAKPASTEPESEFAGLFAELFAGLDETLMAEYENRTRYLASLDLWEMRLACRRRAKTKAKLPRRDAMCLTLQHYEVLRSSATALQTASVSCDSMNPTAEQCVRKKIEFYKAISSNYEQQELIWDRLQIMIGTGALRE